MQLAALCLLAAVPQTDAFTFQRLTIEAARSEIGFDGTSTLHDFTARTRTLGGELRADLSSLASASGGRLWVEVASLDTGNARRDSKMREHLAADRHPLIAFTIDDVEGQLEGGRGTLELRGRFAIRGVERERRLVLTCQDEDVGLRARGEVRFKMTDHAVEPPVVGPIAVRDEVRVWFDLRLTPLAAEALPAQVRPLSVRERLQPLGKEASETRRADRLWTRGTTLVWERPGTGTWALAQGGSPLEVDGRRARSSGPATPVEAAFAQARQRLESLEVKLEAMAPERRERIGTRLAASVERLRAALALAPPEGQAQVLREGESVRVRLGEVDWVVLEDLTGEAPFASALATLTGLPRAVHERLAEVRGLPRRARVRCVTPAGTRTLEFELGEARTASLPSWALEPEGWTERAPGGEGASR